MRPPRRKSRDPLSRVPRSPDDVLRGKGTVVVCGTRGDGGEDGNAVMARTGPRGPNKLSIHTRTPKGKRHRLDPGHNGVAVLPFVWSPQAVCLQRRRLVAA